ncbi:MAG: polysaccharide biosynthesis protein [Caulobacteraceae bacterium]
MAIGSAPAPAPASPQSGVRMLGPLAYDALASAAAFALAYNIASGQIWAIGGLPDLRPLVPGAVAYGLIGVAMAYWQDQHRAVWRYTSLTDAIRIVRVAFLTTLVFAPLVWTPMFADTPRLAPVLAFFLTAALMALPRVAARARADGRVPKPFTTHPRLHPHSVPVIVVGQLERIEPFIRDLSRDKDRAYTAVAILTDAADLYGRHLHGVAVLGAPGDLGGAMAFLAQRQIRPQRLIIADDRVSEDRISEFLDMASAHGMSVGILPRLIDFADHGAAQATVARPIALADLLGRPQAVLDRTALHKLIAGQRVLITGAGGSIGSELARQVCAYAPSRVTLLDASEFNLYTIGQEMEGLDGAPSWRVALCNVRDEAVLTRIFAEERPDLVFHAAALKHVPLVEQNVLEGAHTNVLGTRNVAEACAKFAVRAMVMISTDKAVNPANVMGATKRWAEAYCQAMDLMEGDTRFTAVRFGNVLGSNGSVVPLFQKQILEGGPVTVTHPEVTRFFMTIPEAVELVLQASASGISAHAPRGEVYVLDMGKPIKIIDLARQMIRLSGKQPDIDVKIEFIGLRPGEKLYEELVHEHESHTAFMAGGAAFAVSPRTTELAILRRQIGELVRAVTGQDEDKVLRLLRSAVPEFQFQGDAAAGGGRA